MCEKSFYAIFSLLLLVLDYKQFLTIPMGQEFQVCDHIWNWTMRRGWNLKRPYSDLLWIQLTWTWIQLTSNGLYILCVFSWNGWQWIEKDILWLALNSTDMLLNWSDLDWLAHDLFWPSIDLHRWLKVCVICVLSWNGWQWLEKDLKSDILWLAIAYQWYENQQWKYVTEYIVICFSKN